jgi:hypothetical protein
VNTGQNVDHTRESRTDDFSEWRRVRLMALRKKMGGVHEARISRSDTCRLRRISAVDACLQRGIFLPCRGVEKSSRCARWKPAHGAMDGAAWFRIQWKILLPPTISSGLAIGSTSRNSHGRGRTRCIGASQSDEAALTATHTCSEAIASVALLEIDPKVASRGACFGANRHQKGTDRA